MKGRRYLHMKPVQLVSPAFFPFNSGFFRAFSGRVYSAYTAYFWLQRENPLSIFLERLHADKKFALKHIVPEKKNAPLATCETIVKSLVPILQHLHFGAGILPHIVKNPITFSLLYLLFE